eukprot:scpid80235/ scgid12679/ 
MASGPAYTPIQTTTTEEGAEWRGGLPTSGFKHLQRMSILLFALSVVNLGLQAYVPTAMTSSGEYSWDNITSHALWAAGVTFCTSLYMVWLTTCALRGMKNSKIHLVFGCIGMFLTFGILLGGVVVSGSTASNLQSVQSDPSHICLYFNNTETTAQPPVTLPSGCSDCNPSYSWSNVRPNMCCCCYRDWFSQTTIQFYGVNNCHDIFTYVYPMSTTSAIIYGVSMLLSAIMFVTTCIVGCCQCYACSSFCGPFPPNGGVCMRTSGTRTFTANAQQTAPVYTVTPTMAYPVSAPAAAAGTPAGSSTAGPYQYGGTCEAQNPAAAARLGATAPPSYTDTIATKA